MERFAKILLALWALALVSFAVWLFWTNPTLAARWGSTPVNVNCPFGVETGCLGAPPSNPGTFTVQGNDTNFATFGPGTYLASNPFSYSGSATTACGTFTAADGFNYPTLFCMPQTGQTYISAGSTINGVIYPSQFALNMPGIAYPDGMNENTLPTVGTPLGHQASDFPISITAPPVPTIAWSGTGEMTFSNQVFCTYGGAGTPAVGQNIWSDGGTSTGNRIIVASASTSLCQTGGATTAWTYTPATGINYGQQNMQTQNSPPGCKISGTYPNKKMACADNSNNTGSSLVGWDMRTFAEVTMNSTGGYCLVEDDIFQYDNDLFAQSSAQLPIATTSPGCEAASGGPLGNGGFQYIYNVMDSDPYRSGAQFYSTYGSVSADAATLSGTISTNQLTVTSSTGAGPLVNQTVEIGHSGALGACSQATQTTDCPIITSNLGGGVYQLSASPTVGSITTANAYVNYFTVTSRISTPPSLGAMTPPLGTIFYGQNFTGNNLSIPILAPNTVTCVDLACIGQTFYLLGAPALPTTAVTNALEITNSDFASQKINTVYNSGACYNVSIMWSVFFNVNGRVVEDDSCGGYYEQYNVTYGFGITTAVHMEWEFVSRANPTVIDHNTVITTYYSKDGGTAIHSPFEGGLTGSTISVSQTNNLTVVNSAYASYQGSSSPLYNTNVAGWYIEAVAALSYLSWTDYGNWYDHTGVANGYCSKVGTNGGGGSSITVATLTLNPGSPAGANPSATPPGGAADSSLTGGFNTVTGFNLDGLSGGVLNSGSTLYTYTYACP